MLAVEDRLQLLPASPPRGDSTRLRLEKTSLLPANLLRLPAHREGAHGEQGLVLLGPTLTYLINDVNVPVFLPKAAGS